MRVKKKVQVKPYPNKIHLRPGLPYIYMETQPMRKVAFWGLITVIAGNASIQQMYNVLIIMRALVSIV